MGGEISAPRLVHRVEPEYPPIAVSALTADTDRERARASGFDAYVAKPINPWELCRTISALVSAG